MISWLFLSDDDERKYEMEETEDEEQARSNIYSSSVLSSVLYLWRDGRLQGGRVGGVREDVTSVQ